MEMIKTVTCSIWGADNYSSACCDVTDNYDEAVAKQRALTNAREQFTGTGGDFTDFHRIWYTVVSFPRQEHTDPTISAELPALPDPEAVTAIVS